MFLSHRRSGIESLDAWLEVHAAVHTRMRVHFIRNQNVVSDDALSMRAFDRKGKVGRPIVTVVLQGHARIRAYDRERWLAPGDVSFVESKAAIEMRQSRDAEPFSSVAIEWEPGSIARSGVQGFEVRAIDDATRARIGDLARALAAPDAEVHSVAPKLSQLFELLRRACDAPFEPIDDPRTLIEPVPEQTLLLARGLDVLLSDLRRRPMAVDLDAVLGLSLRQINRVVSAFNVRYGFNSATWRDTRNRRRLLMGATLMTAPGALTEDVALAVGYGSPAAFCRACAAAGFPSPATIAAAVRDLR